MWSGVLLLVLLCVAPVLAETWLQWFMSWLQWLWFVPRTPEPIDYNGYQNEIKCHNHGGGCGVSQVPLHDSPASGYYHQPRPKLPLNIKDTSTSNALHGYPPGKHKRRPWPLLTNAGKSKEQIAKEEKELEKLLERLRDIHSSRIRNNRVW